MKLATLRDGARDGRLVVVSRDVTRCSDARHIAPTLQAALDDWDRLAPHLELVARGVETGGQPVERFHEREAMAPLPRAYGFTSALGGGAAAREASDGFLGPREPARLGGSGFKVQAGVAVVLGELPRGADRAAAVAAVRLVMLAHAVSAADPAERAVAFSPVAVTPEELGPAWEAGRLRGALLVELNGKPLGRFETGEDIDFGALIVEAARSRAIGAGVILAAGGVFRGEAAPGDVLRVEMRDARGQAIFGAVEQRLDGWSGI